MYFINTPWSIRAIDIIANNPYGTDLIIENTTFSVGSIVGAKTLFLDLDNSTVSLSGEAGENGSNIPANDYSALNTIYFANRVILNIDAPIALSSQFIGIGDTANSVLNINNNVTASDPSISGFGSINIASTLNVTGNNANFKGFLNFTGIGGTLTLNGTNSTISGSINGSQTGIGGFNINGNVLLNKPTINLGLNQLNLNGNDTTSGVMNINLGYDARIGKSGNITVLGGSLDLSTLDSLIINIDPKSGLYDLPNKTYTYTVIDANGGAVIPLDITKIYLGGTRDKNRYAKYSLDNDLVLHVEDISREEITTDLGQWVVNLNNHLTIEEPAFVERLIGMDNSYLTDSIIFMNNLGLYLQDTMIIIDKLE